jgi:hypothetical protein
MSTYYNPEGRACSDAEMAVNANYIYSYLTGKGWTKNAIAGILGNMQSESSINPNRWEGDIIGNTQNGYGLVQWTPATKYLDWCTSKGYIAKEMDSNLLRILAEVSTDTQWGNNEVYGAPTYNFEGFTHSTEDAHTLGVNFLLYYERPKVQNTDEQTERGNYATHWYNTLTGGSTGGQGGYIPKSSFKLYQYMSKKKVIIK